MSQLVPVYPSKHKQLPLASQSKTDDPWASQPHAEQRDHQNLNKTDWHLHQYLLTLTLTIEEKKAFSTLDWFR